MSELLVTVADVMVSNTISVAPDTTVDSASALMLEHRLGGLPVTDGQRVVGFVGAAQLLGQPQDGSVADVMVTPVACATPDLSVVQAHEMATSQRLEVLPVVEDGRLVGQVSLVAILQAKSQQTDPLTGLPWAAALRAWAAAELTQGHELAMVFVDLDNFGAVNKLLGHVVGDDVLRAVASLLSAIVDATTDLLCRYGGDEFAIATTRHDADARVFAAQVQEHIVVPLEVDGETRRVTASVGYAGGRRLQRRTAAHAAANVDDLLSLSSRASTRAKESPEGIARHAPWDGRRTPAAAPSAPVEARLCLVEIRTSKGPDACAVAVRLRLGERESIGTATAPGASTRFSHLAADAALAAVLRATGERSVYVVEELTQVPSGPGVLAVVVLEDVSATPRRFIGAARGVDESDAATKAVLDALNRVLARPLAQLLGAQQHPLG
ncbi:MAG TPA: GGDEF domain-containing protein [bacterium]|nr:GGDEF domain-containing protein [bacterium]